MFKLALKLMLNPILIFMFQIQDCAQASGSAPASSFSTLIVLTLKTKYNRWHIHTFLEKMCNAYLFFSTNR